ncbi:ABC transporter permease [Lacticaseibacillus jixiensis]|uniref:ABC transporter permease n=1 Tax=Lacticaseibacillus jixiensis TaxID=3231926 RepID=UPI0036F1BD73
MNEALTPPKIGQVKKKTFKTRVAADFKQNKVKYLMILPVIIYFIVFAYRPMYGVLIAFQDYKPNLGMAGSPWVGFENFRRFFADPSAPRIIMNTFRISIWSIIFGFPAPIILALLINEIRNKVFKRVIQTVTYMPYFISLVVMCALVKTFTQSDGFISHIISNFGVIQGNLLANKAFFLPIYIISGIWQSVGWDSIIYLAALSGIDQEQYEAARIDGAGRFKQMLHVTLPGLRPTIIILFILRMGGILGVGFEKILLLYSPSTYQVADVISTYVYRMGILNADFSYSTAIGLFNNVVNICVLLLANKIAQKTTEQGLF